MGVVLTESAVLYCAVVECDVFGCVVVVVIMLWWWCVCGGRWGDGGRG